MKFSLPSLGRSKNNKPLSEGQRNRRLVVGLALRFIIIFMLGAGAIYVLVGVFTGSNITVPKTAQGVLSDTSNPLSYSWTAESVRLVGLGGKSRRQDAVRQATLDLKRDRYWAVSAGALPERAFFSSDGKLMLRMSQTNIDDEVTWQRWSNICKKDPPAPAKALAMPTPSQISLLDPEILTDKGSYLAQRAWVVGFKPSPALLSQMLGLPFYRAAASPIDNRWVLSDRERKALSDGQFKADTARVWIVRNQMQMMQINVRFKFTIPGGSSWNLLGRRLIDRELGSQPLSKLNFGDPCLNKAEGGLVTPGTNNLPSDEDLAVSP